MIEYDLIVVGSGVGLTLINQGIQMGMNCALIEDAKMGGTCLTRGCIPSKVLVYPADVIREAEHAKKVGLDIKINKIDWNMITKRMRSQIDENKLIEQGLSQVHNLTIYRGIGEFVGDYEMKVKLNENGKYTEVFHGKRIVLASGGRTFIPPINGLNEVGYVTSKSFFGPKFPKKPWNSLIIIGGGVIAAEFAHIFSSMGTKVTIVEMLPHLVSTEEPEISEILEREFSKHLRVILSHKAINVENGNGEKVLELLDMNNKKRIHIRAEEILIATGRKSNADLLHVEKSGIQTDRQGWIIVDNYLETSKPNIWAIGDANGKYQFRHKANYDAEICTRNIFGHRKKISTDYSSVPWAIFTYPQIGHVGMTHKEAIDKGLKIYTAVKPFSSIAKGFAMALEENDALFKLIVDEGFQILGASVIGPHAATLIQQIVYLMNAGYTCPHDEEIEISKNLPKAANACPDAGSFMPIYHSMVIHPSLNEVIGWSLGNLKPVNIAK
ncbi:MAG: dihydrolipoyl dehydrogenase [Promethearchaeota archaeon]